MNTDLDEIRKRAEGTAGLPDSHRPVSKAWWFAAARSYARDVLVLCAEVERLRGDTLCPDCGIPEMWCRLVSTDPKRCWRWDDEKRRELEAELERLRAERDDLSLIGHQLHELNVRERAFLRANARVEGLEAAHRAELAKERAEVERLRKIEEAEARWQNTRRHYFARLRVPLADPPADE